MVGLFVLYPCVLEGVESVEEIDLVRVMGVWSYANLNIGDEWNSRAGDDVGQWARQPHRHQQDRTSSPTQQTDSDFEERPSTVTRFPPILKTRP